MGIGPVKRMGASTKTPYAATGVAEAVVPNITSIPSKKPSMGVPMEAESSSAME